MIDLKSRNGSSIRLLVALIVLIAALIGVRWGSLPSTEPNIVRTTALVVIAVVAATEAIINIVTMHVSEDERPPGPDEMDDNSHNFDDEQETQSDKQSPTVPTGDDLVENQSPRRDEENDVVVGDDTPSPSEFQSDAADGVQPTENQIAEAQSGDDLIDSSTPTPDDPESVQAEADNHQQTDATGLDSDSVPVSEVSGDSENTGIEEVGESLAEQANSFGTESQPSDHGTHDESGAATIQEGDDHTKQSDPFPQAESDGAADSAQPVDNDQQIDEQTRDDVSGERIDPAPRGHESDSTVDSTQTVDDQLMGESAQDEEDDESQSTGRQTVVGDTGKSDKEINPAPRGYEPDWQ